MSRRRDGMRNYQETRGEDARRAVASGSSAWRPEQMQAWRTGAGLRYAESRRRGGSQALYLGIKLSRAVTHETRPSLISARP